MSAAAEAGLSEAVKRAPSAGRRSLAPSASVGILAATEEADETHSSMKAKLEHLRAENARLTHENKRGGIGFPAAADTSASYDLSHGLAAPREPYCSHRS
jgi:hypothetical protein